ncbi:MAG: hypothetical protein QOJ42_8028 [Acidobacteriaceae bacterium]|nr:hypothetical protein [Acidobacteriaceae bacterium]
MSLQRALAHGGIARDRCNGSPALGVADHLCSRLNLRGDCVFCADLTGEKAFHQQDLLPYLRSVGQDALNTVDLLPGQQLIERYRPVVEQVDALVQDGRGADLSETNDEERGAGRVLDHAGAFLQAGDDGIGEILIVQGCRAGLPQDEGQRGLRQ